jgi:hypothetical protein
MLLRRGNRRWPVVCLTLVAIGALLGVEIFRRHRKHLVALDADAMHHALRALRRRAVRVVRRLRGLVLFRHAPDSNTGRPSRISRSRCETRERRSAPRSVLSRNSTETKGILLPSTASYLQGLDRSRRKPCSGNRRRRCYRLPRQTLLESVDHDCRRNRKGMHREWVL